MPIFFFIVQTAVILYVVMPVFICIWMAVRWKRDREQAVMMGGGLLFLWTMGVAAAIAYLLYGTWPIISRSEADTLVPRIIATGVTGVVFWIYAYLIRGLVGRY